MTVRSLVDQCAPPLCCVRPSLLHTVLHHDLPARRYPTIYLVRYENMRNDKFKELREELLESSKCDRITHLVHAPC